MKDFVRSPVNGVINQLNYVTADAYVNTGDVLLEIVPTGSDLIVEAMIDPKDIADIVIGQEVKISLTAYDPSRYGRIDGKVIGISADLSDNQTGQQFYLVDVSIDSTLLKQMATVVILPGMVASLDVLSGKKYLRLFLATHRKTKIELCEIEVANLAQDLLYSRKYGVLNASLNQINNPIENLESLRPLLSDDQTLNRSHFNEI